MRILAVAGFALLPFSAGAKFSSWIVPEAQARCLIEHRDAYLAQGSGIIIIPVSECPNTSPFAGAMDGLKNYGGVSKVETHAERGQFDRIITYTPADLGCLMDTAIRIEDGVAYLPKTVACTD